ncbi:MAG: hypothetical protein MZU79_05470 [Anaerotruncus sp.]|nr:hypothetical protein [Anaerotruncus sp.]
MLTRSDEAYLEQALVEANAGIAAHTVNEVYNYIKNKYLEWQENGYKKKQQIGVLSENIPEKSGKTIRFYFNEIIQKINN